MTSVRKLLAGSVDVVQADLDAHGGLERLLSTEETDRATAFRRRLDRRRYVAARGLLRLLLAERLDQSPQAIRIVTGDHGKPALADRAQVRFNLAHCGADALFAFTGAGDVGIDVERIRPLDPERLSTTCFSKAERAQLLALPASVRLEAFFEGWVRKEAVIKADGRGVSLALDSFTVTLCGPARLVEDPPGDHASWSLMSIDVDPAVRAALAVRSPSPPTRSHQRQRSSRASAGTSRTERPGTPMTTARAGTSLVTTAPAATNASPISTPGQRTLPKSNSPRLLTAISTPPCDRR